MFRKLSLVIMKHRFAVLGIILAVTVLFCVQIKNVAVETQFEDFLPSDHPYIKIHNKYVEQLGDPLKVIMMLKVEEGDVFNEETLHKIKRITYALDSIPGVNHNQVYSIGSRKLKKISVTSSAIFVKDLMETVPANDEEMESFRDIVLNNGEVYGVWLSRDEKSTLFSAAFLPGLVDYNVLFEKVQEIIRDESDEKHSLYAAGEPVLTGWVYKFQEEMYAIFALTFLTLFCLLFCYFRNMVGVVVPMLATIIGGIWGLGFCGILGFNLEPLTLVIPLLIMARALSHSVQIMERYFECYNEHRELIPSCVECTASIVPPGLLGITTDAMGILLIAVAPIPVMQKLAYVCGFWAFSIIFTGLILTPVLISLFKPPKNIAKIVDMNQGATQKILGIMARLGYGKAGATCFGIAVILAGVTGWISSKVDIGDVNPGTPILWEDSAYNVAIEQINSNFPGTEELYVIAEGDRDWAVGDPKVLKVLDSFQRHMERSSLVAGTNSIADFLPAFHRYVYAGYPKFEVLPTQIDESAQLFNVLSRGSGPGDFDRYYSRDGKNANIIIWYKDHMGETIRGGMSWVKEFIKENKILLEDAKLTLQLASGNIGVLAALNETVQESQLLNFALVMGVIFVLCSITYQSMVAAFILMIPLNLTNLITLSIMKGLGIGLNINTLPIVSVGVGVGIDYGIYLLSRLCEEYQIRGSYSLATATAAVKTTGKAIFFTATTMIAAVIFWYFLSSLRFQAEMGLLLAIIMAINMVGALILIPSLVYVFKPKFLGKVKVLIKE